MQLHHPVHALVLAGHIGHKGELEPVFVLRGGDFSGQAGLEDGLHLVVRRGGVHHVVQRVVAQHALVLGEVGHALFQRFPEGGKAVDIDAGDLGELGDVVQVRVLLQVHRLVGTPGGQHGSLEGGVGGQLLVPLQGIHRVVGGADGLDIGHVDEAAHAVARLVQLLLGQLPDLLGGVLVQDALVAEEAAQLQVAPVVQRVADGLSKHLGPLHELLLVAGLVAGDVLLRDARGAHQAPLVVVAAQPHLGDVVVAAVLPDLPGVDVAVVVDDGAVRRRLVKQLFGRFGVQQEILIQKHVLPPKYSVWRVE